jgi:AcrR family transcriptional regulator
VEAGEQVAARPGLRERKKQQTRDAIAGAAMELFAERGYEQTTIAEIADAANVSTRTIFAYFESKEDILFCDEPAFYVQLQQALEDRPADVSTIDALREFLASSATQENHHLALRKKVVRNVESLRHAERARFVEVEQLLAASIAKDLNAGPTDIRPAFIAASMTAAFTTMRDRVEAESGEALSHEQAMAILDEVLEFLRTGLDGVRRG